MSLRRSRRIGAGLLPAPPAEAPTRPANRPLSGAEALREALRGRDDPQPVTRDALGNVTQQCAHCREMKKVFELNATRFGPGPWCEGCYEAAAEQWMLGASSDEAADWLRNQPAINGNDEYPFVAGESDFNDLDSYTPLDEPDWY